MIGTKYSKVKLFFVIACVFVALEVVAFMFYIMYYDHLPSSRPTPLNDLSDVNRIASRLKIPLYILEKELLLNGNNSWDENSFWGKFQKNPVLLGLDLRMNQNLSEPTLFEHFSRNNFKVVPFSVYKRYMNSGHRRDIAYMLQRYGTFQIILLYTLEDNTWWFGNIFDDNNVIFKLDFLGLTKSMIHLNFEGILNKFQITSKQLSTAGIDLLVPKNVEEFLDELSNSYFIECNYTRAENFRNTHHFAKSARAQRFKHRAWKLLADTKTILDRMAVKFWLSSGTCLGYFRECDIIPYSNDVDIGIFAKDYTDNIISEMESHGLTLKQWFGFREDSLELSFIGSNGVKLDIFFFYEDNHTYWNGGTQAKTGLKFKYIFPKFELCWTIFKHLKVRIPCDTEKYIIANYGPNWFIPISDWDWKKSPFNVIPNGRWPKEVWSQAIKIFL